MPPRAAAVGAAFYFSTPACDTSPPVLEAYSSEGGAPTLFDTSGTRLATPIVRQKPDFVGPDGANDTFLGFTLASSGLTGGKLNTTISRMPEQSRLSELLRHLGGDAARRRHRGPDPAGRFGGDPHGDLLGAAKNRARPWARPRRTIDSGYGFVQAAAALAQFPPGTPSLSLAAGSIIVGNSTTLSWSAINATGCTASGGWSGAQATSGTVTVQPAAIGTVVYSLNCTNAAGTSAPSTASLRVNGVPTAGPSAGGGGGGGGGSLDGWSLLGLAALLRRRVFRPHHDKV